MPASNRGIKSTLVSLGEKIDIGISGIAGSGLSQHPV
jgi:hypothetical protein